MVPSPFLGSPGWPPFSGFTTGMNFHNGFSWFIPNLKSGYFLHVISTCSGQARVQLMNIINMHCFMFYNWPWYSYHELWWHCSVHELVAAVSLWSSHSCLFVVQSQLSVCGPVTVVSLWSSHSCQSMVQHIHCIVLTSLLQCLYHILPDPGGTDSTGEQENHI